MNRRQTCTSVALALTFSALLAIASGAAHAVSCGDTITTAATLTSDLNCFDTPPLTLGPGGKLNMNGFTVTCQTPFSNGIVLGGSGNELSNGMVAGCLWSAVVLGGGGGHKVTNVVARDANKGFDGVSDSNQIRLCSAIGNGTGVELTGARNSLSRVMTSRNGYGVDVWSNGNQLSEIGSAYDSSSIRLNGGDGNKVQKSASFSSFLGVEVLGDKNIVQTSRVFGQTTGSGGGSILFEGSDNTVQNSMFVRADFEAIDVVGFFGPANVKSNLVSVVADGGILVDGAGSSVTKNSIFAGNGGIRAYGVGVVISGNAAVGSAPDLYDGSDPACGNTWTANVGKRTQSCIQ